jgi:hypothetical protein
MAVSVPSANTELAASIPSANTERFRSASDPEAPAHHIQPLATGQRGEPRAAEGAAITGQYL